MLIVSFDESKKGMVQEGECVIGNRKFHFTIRESVVDTAEIEQLPEQVIIQFLEAMLEKYYIRLKYGKYMLFKGTDLRATLFGKTAEEGEILEFPAQTA